METNKIKAALECINYYLLVLNDTEKSVEDFTEDEIPKFKDIYETIREVLQDALNPWKEVMCLDLDQEVHNGEYWLLMSKSGEVRKLKFVSDYGYDNEYIPYWISPTDDELEYDDYTFTHYAKPLPNPPEKINE